MHLLKSKCVSAVTAVLLVAFGCIGWVVVKGGANPSFASIMAFWALGIGFFFMSGVALVYFFDDRFVKKASRIIPLAALVLIGFFCASPFGLMTVIGLPFLIPFSAFMVIILVGLLTKLPNNEVTEMRRGQGVFVSVVSYILVALFVLMFAVSTVTDELSFLTYMLKVVIWLYTTLLGLLFGIYLILRFDTYFENGRVKLVLVASAAIVGYFASFPFDLITVFGIAGIVAYSGLIFAGLFLIAKWFGLKQISSST